MKRAEIGRMFGDWLLVRMGPNGLVAPWSGIVWMASHGTKPLAEGRGVVFMAVHDIEFEDEPGHFALITEDAVVGLLSDEKTRWLNNYHAEEAEESAWKKPAAL